MLHDFIFLSAKASIGSCVQSILRPQLLKSPEAVLVSAGGEGVMTCGHLWKAGRKLELREIEISKIPGAQGPKGLRA